jgi:6-phosphofructokinase
MSGNKGAIGILTGGGDVPGLNPAIRAITVRALREGYKVVGIRHGWLGAISVLRDGKRSSIVQRAAAAHSCIPRAQILQR